MLCTLHLESQKPIRYVNDRHVAPQAQALLQRFRGLRDVFAASPAELRSVPGIGEQSALLLGIIARLMEAAEGNDNQVAAQQPVQQPTLFALGSPPQQVRTPAEEAPPPSDTPVMEDAEASVLGLTEATNEEPDQVTPAPAAMRIYANDEIASSLQFLPHAATHTTCNVAFELTRAPNGLFTVTE